MGLQKNLCESDGLVLKILALDTTSNVGSIALLENENVLEQVFWENASSHTSVLAIELRKILSKASLPLDEIDLWAVSQGPGSFTGLRIALAFVKGITLMNEKPVLGISTLEAMRMLNPEHQTTLTCPVLDARRGQVFAAVYRAGECLLEEACYEPRKYFEQVKSIIDSESVIPYFVGNGTEIYVKDFQDVFVSNSFKIIDKFNLSLSECVARTALLKLQQGLAPAQSSSLRAHYLRSSAAEG